MGTVHRLNITPRTDPDRTEWQGQQPQLQPIVAPLREPGVALRILAEASLIDAAYRANSPDWAAFDPVILDILMNRR